MKGEKSEWSDKLKQVTDVYNDNFKEEFKKYQEGLMSEEKKEAQKELDKLQLEMEQTGEVVENIKSKYNEDEFQAAFLENCEVAKKMLEIGEGLQDIGE